MSGLALSRIFLLPHQIILPNGRDILNMLIFELQQSGNLVIAHFIIFDLLFDEIVQGDLVVVDHIVGVYNVIIAG